MTCTTGWLMNYNADVADLCASWQHPCFLEVGHERCQFPTPPRKVAHRRDMACFRQCWLPVTCFKTATRVCESSEHRREFVDVSLRYSGYYMLYNSIQIYTNIVQICSNIVCIYIYIIIYIYIQTASMTNNVGQAESLRAARPEYDHMLPRGKAAVADQASTRML